jgi:hypothetical protein
MARLSKQDLLGGSDLREEEFKPSTLGGEVLVRGLGAEFSNQAQSEALEVVTDKRGRQTARVNTAKMEQIQVLHGLVDPKLDSIAEAEQFLKSYGPAAKEIVAKIDELSGLDKESIAKAEATFPGGGEPETGTGSGVAEAGPGAGGSTVPPRTGD